MRTNVYVDGFNLYYRVKDTPYKWLDLSSLCRLVLPKHLIVNRIRYFTAMVRATPNDSRKPQRQVIFIRALQTIPNLTVHYGQFLSHRKRMALADPPPGGPQTVEVIKTEEKGSDVNLATWLLFDCFRDEYDVAVVISNDSDLVEPIKIVRYEFGREIGVVNPQKHRTSFELVKVASFCRKIRDNALESSQFPPVLTDAHGSFSKPSEW